MTASVPRVYEKAMASADADGVTFVVNGQLHVFRLSETALKRLSRQIDAALKDKSARARKPKA